MGVLPHLPIQAAMVDTPMYQVVVAHWKPIPSLASLMMAQMM